MSDEHFDINENLHLLSKEFETNQNDFDSLLSNLSEQTEKNEIDPEVLLTEVTSSERPSNKKTVSRKNERSERKKDSLGFTIISSTKNVPKKQYSEYHPY